MAVLGQIWTPPTASTTLEAVEADLHVAVEADAGDPLDGAGEQGRPAEGVGGVDLVASVPGDGHIGVAGQADQHRLAGAAGDVQQHHGVGTAAGGLAGAELAAAALVQALAAVRPDDQPVGTRGGRRPPLVVGQGVDPGEPGVDPDAQPDQQHDQHEQDHAEAPAPAPGPAGLGGPATAPAGIPRRPLLAGPDVGWVEVAGRPLAHAPGPDAPAGRQRLLRPLPGRVGPPGPLPGPVLGPATHRSNLLVGSSAKHRAPPPGRCQVVAGS